MITKESLIKNREQSNVAVLKLKQSYDAHSNQIYLIVEGKDDVAYYRCIFIRYTTGDKIKIIPASNRDKVIEAYCKIDWKIYSPRRVFFFVDRDLSEITGEFTPQANNVYVTDNYSIENSLFNKELLFVALQTFYGMDDLKNEEKAILSALYSNALRNHEQTFLLIMCWILHWRLKHFKCNLNNLNSGDFFCVEHGVFKIRSEYQEPDAIVQMIHRACGVEYQEQDISDLETVIEKHGGIHKCIRGKFVRAFFVKFLLSITESMECIIPERKKPKAIVALGPNNVLQLLCGYMETPASLSEFVSQIFT